MSDEDYNAAFRSSLGRPQQDASADPQPARQAPVEGFWGRLGHSVKLFFSPPSTDPNSPQNKQLKDIMNAVPRGFANAANNLSRTAFEFGAFIDRRTGLGELMQPGFNAAYDEAGGARGFVDPESVAVVKEDEMLLAYGNRSDDPIASFTEASSQFIAGLALARVAGFKNIYVQGAISDATAFDPYEAQLAELAARAPNWTGIGLLGKLASVEADDGALTARIKRSAAGVVSSAILDGLIAGARWIRGNRVLANPAATAAERAAAQETVTQAETVIQNVADASHTADGDHVVVRPTENGHYQLETNPSSPLLEQRAGAKMEEPTFQRNGNGGPKKASHVIQQTGAPEVPTKPLTLGEAARQADLAVTAGKANHVSDEVMAELTAQKKQADEALANGHPDDLVHPVMKDRGEAEAQAATMNAGLNERLNAARGVTPEQEAQHFQIAKDLLEAQTPEEIAARAQDANFNLSYYTDQPAVMAQIEAISKQFRRAMDAAQKRPGGIPVEESIRIARQAIGGMTEREAPAVLRAKLKSTEDLHAWLLASDMVMRDMGKKIANMADILEARPHDAIAHEEARNALGSFYALARDLGGANSEIGRTLRIMQERANAATHDIKFKPEGAQAPKPKEAPTPGVETQPLRPGRKKVQGPVQLTAGMSHRDIAAQARMFKLAGGEPRNAFAVAHAAQVIQKTGILSKAFEVFANFLLSGPRTVQTVLVSGAGLNMFEPIVRMGAGAIRLNPELLREGADIMWGNFKYLGDNLRTAAASLRANRSIINPQPQHIAIGGLTGEVIRVPGRVLTAADELSRVTAYRAFVRAKSLRLGRSQGLTGAALEARVAEDLRNAFDAETGIATLPDALKYAEVPTMSGPLGGETLGGGLQHFVNNHLEARFIAPFVKSSVNIFRYVHKSIPVLNMANAETRAAIQAGGEQAAIIHARSALATGLYGFGLYQAMAGNLTGRGPSDPELRKLWLKNHQPYSIKLGDSWHSYARLDPLGMPLGLIGDLHTIIQEQGEKSVDASDMAYATVASMFYSLSSKSYMSGITQFADAWASNDPHATMRWMQNFGANITVPQGVASLNPDPIYRDVRSMSDAIFARIPGYSEKLDPRFDIFGEPVLKTPGLVNRNLIVTSKDAGHSVEDDLFAIGRGLSPFNPKLENGLIDLRDPNAYDNGTHKSPYRRFMELLRNPGDGRSSMRQAMVDLVKSPEWHDASDGTSLFPGGERWLRAAAVKTEWEQRALQQVMEEYPKVRDQIQLARRLRGAAVSGGEQGIRDVESLFGTLSK